MFIVGICGIWVLNDSLYQCKSNKDISWIRTQVIDVTLIKKLIGKMCIDKRQPSWILFLMFLFFSQQISFFTCSIGVDGTGIANEKTSKTGSKKEDIANQQEKASNSKSANVKSASSTSSNRNNGESRVGACTRSRIVKKPRRDFSPPESPVKKPS